MTASDPRSDIVNAGLVLMAQRGFNGVGLKDIVGEAGVPKGSFYYYFDSKEAFGAALVDAYGAGGHQQRHRILAETSGSPLEQLRRYFETLRDTFEELGFAEGCFLGAMGSEMADHSDAIRQSLAAAFEDWRQSFIEVVVAAQDAGEIGGHWVPETLADYLINAWEGALIRMKIEKTSRPLNDFIDVTFTHLLKG